MSTIAQHHPEQIGERTLKASIRTKSGSEYRLDGEHVVLIGPGGRPYQEFRLVSLDGARLIYTDGQQVFRSSEIVDLSAA